MKSGFAPTSVIEHLFSFKYDIEEVVELNMSFSINAP
jgi:hypothetical protein